jgi:hypothetical protein
MTSSKWYSALVVLLLLALGLTGCTDPTVEPKSSAAAPNILSEPGAYKSYLAKLYGGLNVTGQSGPAGNGDIAGIDEGFSQYMRLWWEMQELPTDAAVIAWNDNGIRELNNHSWSSSNQFSRAIYDRIFFQVSQSNEFLRQSTPDLLDARGVPQDVQQRMPQWRAEARFLRALSYWHAVDLFGPVPLVTQDFTRGSEAPPQATRQEVFEFVEDELRAITDGEGDEELPDPGAQEYGRADKAAAWMVLAKLYQNAEVYVGENRSSDVIEFTTRIIDSGAYSLDPEYHDLFLADNQTADGIIFSIPHDGQRTQHFGGTTFLGHAPLPGAAEVAERFGLNTGWEGLRTTSATVDLYSAEDTRPVFPNMPNEGQFLTQGRTKEIADIGDYLNGGGYLVPKYQNVTSTGEPGADLTFSDTDYPMFRLADAYLMYAEAVLRGGGGSVDRAVELVNDIRERAGLGRDITSSSLTLDFIIDERGRELLWEAHRRTDLIRFGQFTSADYIWPWKGGVKEGRATESYRNLYPLPASELRANPNLDQNSPEY